MAQAKNDLLTCSQKKLLAELRQIGELTRLDYENIIDYDPDERGPRLRLMKNQLIRSQIIIDYTFADEMLGAAICHYFFGKKRDSFDCGRRRNFESLITTSWRCSV
jgi:hypothetical protein